MQLQRAASRNLAHQIFGGNEKRVLALLRAAWPAAVGPELARRTEVVALEGRTLRIRVPDAGWRKVLHRMRADIVDRLGSVAGRLAPLRLGFMEAPFAPSAPHPGAPGSTDPAPAVRLGHERPPATVEDSLPPHLEVEAATIADPEIRARFLETARRYLHRTRPS